MLIQVEYRGQIVGALNRREITSPDRIPGELGISLETGNTAYVGGDWGPEGTNRTSWVQTKKRFLEVASSTIDALGFGSNPRKALSNRDLKSALGIPEYARGYLSMRMQGVEFSWYVLSPNTHQYQSIFLKDDFQPL